MRKEKTVTIDGEKISVFELRVKDIMALVEIFQGSGSDADNVKEITQTVQEILPRATTLTLDEAREMAPSDLKKIYDVFREVNEVFFQIAHSVKLDEVLIRVGEAVGLAVQLEFKKLFVTLSAGGTDSETS